MSFRQRAPRAEPQSPPPRILGPAVRPHLQRALPATLRRGAGPDTAALGLREDRTNDRLPADPRSGFAHLGPEPITRGRSLSFSSQSDAEAKLPVLKEFLSLKKFRKQVHIMAFLTPAARRYRQDRAWAC